MVPLVPCSQIHTYSPFSAHAQNRRFVLYLAARSPTSGGASAAWISKYHHGLQLLENTLEGEDQIVWLDLASEFADSHLAEVRLRLHDSRYQSARNIFESARIVSLFDSITEYLLSESPPPSLKSYLQQPAGNRILVVVSGWDQLSNATPNHLQSKLKVLLSKIVEELSVNIFTVVWFDSPVPGELRSAIYSTRTLLPFYPNSPLSEEVTEIVWNLPVPPGKEILPHQWKLPIIPVAPLYDDIRTIVYQDGTGFRIELTVVPPLLGWSDKFRGDGFRFRQKTKLAAVDNPVLGRTIREQMKLLSLDLLPWLVELWPDTLANQNLASLNTRLRAVRSEFSIASENVAVRTTNLESVIRGQPSILQRFKLRPKDSRSGLSYRTLTTGRINSRRLYRSRTKLKTKKRHSYELVSGLPDVPHSTTQGFGYQFILEESDRMSELLVVEDMKRAGLMLIGLFTEESKSDQSGYVWSAFNPNRIREILANDDLVQAAPVFIENQNQLNDLWIMETDGHDWIPVGKSEFVSGTGGRIAPLRAIRIAGDCSSRSNQGLRVPDHLKNKCVDVARRFLERLLSSTLVRVTLSRGYIGCEVVFSTPESDVVVHSVEVQGTSDLIDLLRWPLKTADALQIPNGLLIRWNPFHDIEYGELESIRPFIETTAPELAEREIQPLVSELFSVEDEDELKIVLYHDEFSCPLYANGHSHGECWLLKIQGTVHGVEGIPDEPLNGKKIYGLLTKCRLTLGGKTYSVQLTLNLETKNSDLYVFSEEPWIRRLMSEYGVRLDPLEPGTFLESGNEKWTIDFAIQDMWFLWTAISTITGVMYGGGIQRARLLPVHSLDEVIDSLTYSIIQEIGSESISKLTELKKDMRIALKRFGFGEKGLRCKLSVKKEQRKIIVVLKSAGKGKAVLIREWPIDRINEGEFAELNIVNSQSFIDELKSVIQSF
ncbi:MAG: hypothetical protein ACW992_00755 [Candidatus Thorarchaeota archaeon]|jgi:hypothetical protein